MEMPITDNYKFFHNDKCEFQPCHTKINSEEINCLFCYCPLYTLEKCPGNFQILSNGVKDCSNCIYPHKKENYDNIVKLLFNVCGNNKNLK